ncbi:MAG: hypothetical protein E7256_10275 [Lachnospiraceae bacterium]|nr:hypothetical protein [Lachnospiraceae bacterium]
MLPKIDGGKKKFLMLSMIFGIMALCTCGCGVGSMGMPQDLSGIWNFGEYGKETKNSYDEQIGERMTADSYSYYSDQQFFALMKPGRSGSIYDAAYQEAAKETLEHKKREQEYTIDSPLFILNPFGTNVTGLYVYMGNRKERVQVSYVISVEDTGIPDFCGTMYLGTTEEDAVEGQVIGMLPGMVNKVVLTVMKPDGTILSEKAYYFDVPAYSQVFSSVLPSQYAQDAVLTRGFYILSATDGKTTYFLFYDNYGILRAQIPTEAALGQNKLLQADNHLFFAISGHRFVMMDHLGYVSADYEITGSEACDYIYDNKKKCILLLIREEESPCASKVKKLNLETKEITNLVDFESLLGSLKSEVAIIQEGDAKQENTLERENTLKQKNDPEPKNGMAEEESDKEDDWLGIISIKLVDSHDILASSKKLSMIIRVNNVYTSPVVRWMIGSEAEAEKMGDESLMLTKAGDFLSQARQDVVYYAKEKKAKEGQYYLLFLNHNSGEVSKDSKRSDSKKEGEETERRSYFYCYAVDEILNQYRLVKRIPLPYTAEKGTAVPYGKHVIISIGKEKTFMEYNDKGELVSQFKVPDIESSYKVYKATMDRYWF